MVRLSAQLLQGLQARIQAAARQLSAVRVLQQQSAVVVAGGTQVAAAQRQLVQAISVTEAEIGVAASSVQQLLAQAMAGGGVVAISLAAAQQLLASLQAVLSSTTQVEALQRQVILLSTGVPTGVPTGLPVFPQFQPWMPSFSMFGRIGFPFS